MAPAKTPLSVTERLNSEVARIMAKPASRERLASEGVEGARGTPAEFAARIRAEIARLGAVVKAAGIRAD